jgi:GT2 family glycosyltransferase
MFHLDSLYLYGIYRMTEWDQHNHRQVEVAQGAALILRRTALDQVGLLDTDYFIYTEEVDLCYRLLQGGWYVYYVPRAQVVHYGGQSTQQVAADMFLNLYSSKLLFFRKHYGWFATPAYKTILLTASVIRLLVSPLAWLEAPARRRQHLTLINHYWLLVKALPGL